VQVGADTLRDRLARMATLLDVARMVSSELDVRHIVHRILTKAISVIPAADAGTLYLEDEASGRLVATDSVGFGPSILKLSLKPGEAAAGRAYLSGRGAIYPDQAAVLAAVAGATEDTIHNFHAASAGARSPKAAMTAPLVFKGAVLGVLVVDAFRGEDIFSAEDFGMLEDFAQIAATAIANARLYESEHANRVRLEVLNGEITRQRDELDRRLSALDSMSQIARQALGLKALGRQLACLTNSRAYILDGLARVRAAEPTMTDTAYVKRLLESVHCVELLRRVGRDHHPRAVMVDGIHLAANPIVSGADLLGYVLVEAEDPALPHVNEALAEMAALIASTVFVRERALEDGVVRSRADLLERLLDGKVPRSAGSFQTLPPPLQLAVGKLRRGESTHIAVDGNILREVCTLAQQVLGTCPFPTVALLRGEHVVVAWSPGLGEAGFNPTQKLNTIASVVEASTGSSVRFALTEIIKDPHLVPQMYQEARLAVEMKLGGQSIVVDASSLGAYRLIIGATSSADAVAFSRRTLARLIEHDGKQPTALVGTLRIYLARGLSLSLAARELRVHVHTVKYRLTKLEEMTGLSLRNTEDRLTLELALRILDLAGPDPAELP
jgi:GAF domain-containing protein